MVMLTSWFATTPGNCLRMSRTTIPPPGSSVAAALTDPPGRRWLVARRAGPGPKRSVWIRARLHLGGETSPVSSGLDGDLDLAGLDLRGVVVELRLDVVDEATRGRVADTVVRQ